MLSPDRSRSANVAGSMSGVRNVAGCFFVIGWIMLVVGGLAALAVLGSIGSSSGGIAGALVPLSVALGASLSPFFLWAVLHALIEIHETQRGSHALLRDMFDIERS